ncbi:MAG: (d)CMP kinase [Rhizobiales bacterium]|nr:(d)CMP kinase [Hyphomicrobiales bacterium]NRB14426.1 (d)CMP kinase [Hyphomicrobiales bacterium]
MIIAIDGPEASGKGTVAKLIAKKYNLRHLDSGLLYRLTGVPLIGQKFNNNAEFEAQAIKAAGQINAAQLDSPPEIARTMQGGVMASKVAVIPQVRDILTAIQKNIAKQKPGAVIDGRDIGTVVFPNAELKFWVTASIESRASRRFAEYQAKGRSDSLAAVSQAIAERDHRDSSRAASPMVRAQDAHLIETSKLSIEGVVEALSVFIDAKLADLKGSSQN